MPAIPEPLRDHASLGRLSATAAVLFWSAGNVMVANLDMPGIRIAFWRQVLAAVVFGAAFLVAGRRLTWAALRLAAPAGVLLGLDMGAHFSALRSTTVANATIIGSLGPIVLLAVAARRYRESVTGWLLGASLVAVVGVALVVLGASAEVAWSPQGDLLALLATFTFAIYLVVVKDVRARIDTFTLQTIVMVVSALTVFPLAVVHAGTLVLSVPSSRQWVWLVALVAVPGTAHFLMNWAHLHVRLSLVGLLTLAIPVLSTVAAWPALGQRFTILQALGGALVIGVLSGVVRRDARLAAQAP